MINSFSHDALCFSFVFYYHYHMCSTQGRLAHEICNNTALQYETQAIGEDIGAQIWSTVAQSI